MHFSEFILLSYPLIETRRCLKYPRLKRTKHWLIFWYIFILLELFEFITLSWFPLWGLIKPALILINWKPAVTEVFHKFINVSIKHGYIKLKKFEEFETVTKIIKDYLPLVNYCLEHPYTEWIIWFISENDKSNEKKKF